MMSSEVWLKIRKTNITDIDKLCDFLKLAPPLRKKLLKQSPFSLNIPLHIARKIKKNTLDDPLLRQFVPLQEEDVETKGFVCDPVCESHYRLSPNLLSKYVSRALLIPTQACGIHCRYCFRRHFPYASGRDAFEKEIALIAADSSLSEVILSGGDPLSLPNSRLGELIGKLEKVPHIKRLRFHSRFPLGIPERIDEGFLKIVQECSLQVVFVLHCNHVNELDDTVIASLKQLQRCGIPLLTQSVLLKGVNDTFDVLLDLFETLGNHGMIPYYLHQLDPVKGAAHFHVDEDKGIALMKELQKHLSGYTLPRYVKEVPGEPHKTTIY